MVPKPISGLIIGLDTNKGSIGATNISLALLGWSKVVPAHKTTLDKENIAIFLFNTLVSCGFVKHVNSDTKSSAWILEDPDQLLPGL